MKRINLKRESPSVGELLAMARKKSVLLVSKDGATFVLEEADEFDREVAQLGGSERFMKFLGKRSKENAATSIEQFAKELIPRTGLQPSASSAKRSAGSKRLSRSRRLKP